MPASVFILVFQDPNLEKLAPSSLEIGTYTTDTLKIVCSCMFFLGTSWYQEIIGSDIVCFNEGWECSTIMKYNTDAWLNKPRTRLDYLPARAS